MGDKSAAQKMHGGKWRLLCSAMYTLCIVVELAIKPVFDITFLVSLMSRAPHNTTMVARKPN
jgi:hypothetical protein